MVKIRDNECKVPGRGPGAQLRGSVKGGRPEGAPGDSPVGEVVVAGAVELGHLGH